ncbi:MAG: septum formation initiator family protein [Actinomycetota bacterium]|nr:septum formation initiator family protein [Actinomycetota bacterium]
MRVRPRALALAVLVVALLVASVYPIRTYLGQRAQIHSLEREALILERANARTEHRIKSLHDPAELERLARECLGMVKHGEIAFVVVPKGGHAATPSDC